MHCMKAMWSAQCSNHFSFFFYASFSCVLHGCSVHVCSYQCMYIAWHTVTSDQSPLTIPVLWLYWGILLHCPSRPGVYCQSENLCANIIFPFCLWQGPGLVMCFISTCLIATSVSLMHCLQCSFKGELCFELGLTADTINGPTQSTCTIGSRIHGGVFWCQWGDSMWKFVRGWGFRWVRPEWHHHHQHLRARGGTWSVS